MRFGKKKQRKKGLATNWKKSWSDKMNITNFTLMERSNNEYYSIQTESQYGTGIY